MASRPHLDLSLEQLRGIESSHELVTCVLEDIVSQQLYEAVKVHLRRMHKWQGLTCVATQTSCKCRECLLPTSPPRSSLPTAVMTTLHKALCSCRHDIKKG